MRGILAVAFLTLLGSCGGGGSGGGGSGGLFAIQEFEGQPSDGDVYDVVTDSAAIRVRFVDVLDGFGPWNEVAIGPTLGETMGRAARFVDGTALLGVEARFAANADFDYAGFVSRLGCEATASGREIRYGVGPVEFPGTAFVSVVEVVDQGGTWSVR